MREIHVSSEAMDELRAGDRRLVPLSVQVARAEKVAAKRAVREAARLTRPTAILRALAVGGCHVFPGRYGSDLSPYIAALRVKEGLRFRTRQTPQGVEVTRIEPPHPATGLV